MIEWLSVLGDISNIVLASIGVGAIVLSPNIRAYFSGIWEYRNMRGKERDILKVIMSTRIGTLIRKDGEVAQFIQLVPIEDGANVWISHINVSGHYRFALDHLVHEGYLKEGNGEEGVEYILTSLGERFIERFSKNLRSHKYAGSVRDDVHHAKMQRLNTQYILGTVHAAIGAEPLGVETDPYANIFCIPPTKQKNGVVAHAYIIAKELPVVNGDTVFVKFEDVPYHIHTYLTPRWAGNRFLGEEEKQVPTAIFTVKGIQQANGNQILVLSPGSLMMEVTTGDKNDKA